MDAEREHRLQRTDGDTARSRATYVIFVDRPADASTVSADDAHARLRWVRTAVDPDGLMVGKHPIPAA